MTNEEIDEMTVESQLVSEAIRLLPTYTAINSDLIHEAARRENEMWAKINQVIAEKDATPPPAA
jgi:hypothetical protein